MDDDLMKVWVEETGVKHAQTGYKRLGFQNAMVSFDPFSGHLTDGLKNQLLEGNCDILILAIPAGCTSKCQPMHVCPNKPFKAILRKC